MAAQTDTNYHLILVDDGSTDGTREMVRGLIPSVTVLRGTGDWWWAGCLQQARHWLMAQRAAADGIVLIANDDTIIAPDFLAAGRMALLARPKSLLLAQLRDSQTGETIEVGVYADWAGKRFVGVHDPQLINCFSTRGLFIRSADFLDLGDFHPRLLPHYGSDYEFTMRAHRRGLGLVTDPGVWLLSDESTTGIRIADTHSVRAFLRSTLSKRSTHNPVYSTTLVLLSCPRPYVLRNIGHIWKTFLNSFARTLRGVS